MLNNISARYFYVNVDIKTENKSRSSRNNLCKNMGKALYILVLKRKIVDRGSWCGRKKGIRKNI